MATERVPCEPDELWAQLCAEVGPDLAAWVLDWQGGELSDTQSEVARWILKVSTADPALADFPSHVRHHALINRLPSTGRTVVNELRRICGGVPDESDLVSTGDSVLDALRALAVECYGELLLSPAIGGVVMVTPYWSDHATEATELMRSDPRFRFADREGEDPEVTLVLSTGSAGPVTARGVVAAVIGDAFETNAMQGTSRSLEALLDSLADSLDRARRVLNGEAPITFGVASLTGVVTPPGFEADLGWGRLRALSQHEQPALLGELATRRTLHSLPDGSEATIHDAGDVAVVVRVPINADIRDAPVDDPSWANLTSYEEFNRRIDQARLGLLLSSENVPPPVLLPVWRRLADPVMAGGGMGWSDPKDARPRTPTVLTDGQCVEWARWTRLLDTVPQARLRSISSRLLRATTESRVSGDMLIDAVIVWEALFGTSREVTFRVTAAIAKLLRSHLNERGTLQKELGRIYDKRSQLVHGHEVNPTQLHEASTRAFSIAVETLRALVRDRPDLVDLPSDERGRRLLLE